MDRAFPPSEQRHASGVSVSPTALSRAYVVRSYRSRSSKHVSVDPAACWALRRQVEEPLEQVELQRKHDGRVLLGCDFGERLLVGQLQGGRLAANQHLGGVGELLAGTEFTLGVDDLGPLLAPSLRLTRDQEEQAWSTCSDETTKAEDDAAPIFRHD